MAPQVWFNGACLASDISIFKEEPGDMAVADPVPLCFGGLTLDQAARTLVNAVGESISLRRSEFELLLAFVDNPGRALGRDYLLEMVAGRHSEAFDRSIDVLVGRLRRKIEREPGQPSLILTVPGVGYRLAVKPYPALLPAEEKDKAGSTTSLPTPRLSIVVLPFTNLSDDREQQYFADGVTDDLTTDLSRLPHIFVSRAIPRSPIGTSGYPQSRSAANSACATCLKEVSAGQATRSASTPS